MIRLSLIIPTHNRSERLIAALESVIPAATAQNVSWKSSVEHLEGDVYRIVLEASIPAPYHMYDMGPYEGGPNATAIVFTPGDGVTLEGGVEQLSTPERHYDKAPRSFSS